ncbi:MULTISPECIES: hypothetical protein [Clostridium]|uniref:Uncharacterized protein n=2 Tax=Clostridium TaxID=1485 RepID=A0A151AL49_9CLOT|nr:MULTISPECIES: hypothetical protein [Clostridium]KYH28351.1 hypothetical protein CLCOL_20770 [Clostridium colicanis DSM 13634]MBE6043592.1 hypothetical protein [Clostridium thermopalmarium]PRR68793.1 hypothetical protein CPAL_26920 [Clostridium thermopalmarium DSM 5974]PVZ22624.1 hypothetical protein LX19_01773 [Clostridium thermopalmarium DSM 5974]
MKVIFEFKDINGKVSPENNVEKELTNDEILVILNSKEVDYPVNNGFLFTVKHCIIENSTYDMFTEPYKLKISLREKA